MCSVSSYIFLYESSHPFIFQKLGPTVHSQTIQQALNPISTGIWIAHDWEYGYEVDGGFRISLFES